MSKLAIIPLFLETIKKYGDKEALRAKNKEGNYYSQTYNEFNAKVTSFSLTLIYHGIKKGDRVAVLSEDCPEWVISDLAIISDSAINVPIYPTLKPEQIRYILNDCQAKIIIVSSMIQAEKILEIEKDLPALTHMIVIDDISIKSENKLKIMSFKDALEFSKKIDKEIVEERQRRFENIQEEDVISIVYTSGTTGEPKGVMLMNKNFASNAITVSGLVNLSPFDVELAFLPLSHVLERVCYYAMIFSGSVIVYADSLEKVPQNMVEVKPTVLISVPRLFEKIHTRIMTTIEKSSSLKKKLFNWGLNISEQCYELEKQKSTKPLGLVLKHKIADKLIFSKIRAKTGGNLRLVVSGGAPLKKEVAEFLNLVGIKICEGYGLTETSPVICVNRPDAIKFGTVGPPIPDVEIKIAEDGEILCKGPNVMKGYYNKPEATAEVLDKDGWLYTGDIGYLDKDGYLVITDRKKEIIVLSTGKNVAPQAIENKLKESKYIEQALAIGDKRSFITALVALNAEAIKEYASKIEIQCNDYNELCKNEKIHNFILSQVTELCKNFSPYEQIKKITILSNEFTQEDDELTPTLKYKRRNIHKRYNDLIKAMYNNK